MTVKVGGPYDELGVRAVLNAAGTVTRLGGTRMDAEVLDAMRAAAAQFVPMDQLHATVSERVAAVTGTEAALVTSGAAAGLTLAAAACLAGGDFGKMDQLPDTSGMPNEIVVPRSHRNGYDHALRAAGAKLVDIGLAERTRDPQPWEFDAAINERTVAISYSDGFSALPLATAVAAARRHGLPLIVDAAASLPPRSNLRAFSDAGADLITFSGGKAIRGPQSSGILCGRRELIRSAALQMWDMDLVPSLWRAPDSLLDPSAFTRGVPNHGIGRAMKAGKEEIVGLWTALERFVQGDEPREIAMCTERSKRLASALGAPQGVNVRLVDNGCGWKQVELEIDADAAGLSAVALARALEEGTPSICLAQGFAEQGRVEVDPFCLTDDEASTVARRVIEVLDNVASTATSRAPQRRSDAVP